MWMKYSLAFLAVVMVGCAITGSVTQIPSESTFNYSVYFCGECLSHLKSLIIDADQEILCAFYNVDDEIVQLLEDSSSSVELIVDSRTKIKSNSVIKRKSKGLMHNKFCVFDRKVVWTGSFNPVISNRRVLDDVIIINSSLLAENYANEFLELKSNGSFKTKINKILLNKTIVENYFCPEDQCIYQLQKSLRIANRSIYFATYSFTHPIIANELIAKKNEGITVRGIMEKGSKYSQYQTLKSNDVEVVEDSNKRLLHHKFFIIDNRTVITGSFNPTRNGNERNDENFLVLHNQELAGVYLRYFEELMKTIE